MAPQAYLSHGLSVRWRIMRRLRDKKWLLLWRHLEAGKESMPEYSVHVVGVSDDSSRHRGCDLQELRPLFRLLCRVPVPVTVHSSHADLDWNENGERRSMI